MYQNELLEQAYQYAQNQNLIDLAHKSGVEYWWLVKFAAGKIADPGFSKIQRLLAYITESQSRGDSLEQRVIAG